MSLSSLQKRLTQEYGSGNYLTNRGVDWHNPIEFEPQFSYCPDIAQAFLQSASPTEIDDPIVEGQFDFGQGFASLWNTRPAELEIGYDYTGVFLLGITIKRPGEKTYRIPRIFEPMLGEFQRQANHHFARSKHAIDKIIGVSLRSLPLVEGVKQISEGLWHTHRPYNPELVRMAKDMYDITDDQLIAMQEVSQTLLPAEYYVSNICPTLMQTGPLEVPAKVIHGINSTLPPGVVPDHRQLDDCESVLGNGYVYHTAASVPPELVGERRTFCLTSYSATKRMERHFF